jgi:hypothetical protein
MDTPQITPTISVINPFPLILPLRSVWADAPMDLDAPLDSGAWAGAGRMKFPKGWVLVKNDARFLYLALDVVDDVGNDPGTGDYFWLTFDVNRDRSITANKDLNFGTPPNQPDQLMKQFYLGPNRWTGLQATPSAVRTEFGPSENSAKKHRIWKFRIDLAEIAVNLAWPLGTPHTFFGFRVNSTTPSFIQEVPTGFASDFAGLRQLVLSRRPTISESLLGPVIGSVGLIPTTAISASGRATTEAGYFLQVQNAAFGGTLNLIGNRTTLANLWSQGARKYRVQIAPPGAASYSDLISTWSNYRWNPSQNKYVLVSHAPTAAGFYQLPNPGYDYSIDDLLIQFPTGSFAPGIHRVRVAFYQNDAVTIVPSTPQILKLYIDNHIPLAVIESIQYKGAEVSACAIQKLGAAPDGVRFRITASDGEGNLLGVTLEGTYGNNQKASIFNQQYAPAMGNWAGFTNQWVPATGTWRPPQTCAYSFVLRVTARTTNGYNYIGHNIALRNLTLML